MSAEPTTSRRPRGSCALAVAALALTGACGGKVFVDSAATTEGVGGGAASGVGGAHSTASSGFGGSSFTTSSGLGGVDTQCPDAHIDVLGDGPPRTLVDSCAGQWGSDESSTPVAFAVVGRPFVGEFEIRGCRKKDSALPSLQFALGNVSTLGTYDGDVVVHYSNEQGGWDGAPGFSVTLTAIGEVGSTVEGTYAGTVDPWPRTPGVEIALSGSFVACRVQDFSLP